MIYLELFLGFLKVGLFAFGGAYAAIPFIREVVLSYGWISDDMLSTMIAVSESTPGPIMVNLATYIGANQGGILGAVVANIGVILPAFVIVILILTILKKILNNPYLQATLAALKPCVIGIILEIGLVMMFENLFDEIPNWDVKSIILTLVLGTFFFSVKYIFKKKMSPILFIVISAALGVVTYGLI